MAEAELELRRVTERMFEDMGISHLPMDTLDFFQNNLENGSSSDWKASLKGPSTRPLRTSSDGTALLHLKKKYSTGLNPDYHSKRIAAIAAATQKPSAAEDGLSNDKPRSRKPSPASGPKARFGYSGPSTKNSSSAAGEVGGSSKPGEGSKQQPEEVKTDQSRASAAAEAPSPTSKEEQKSMLQRRSLRFKPAVSSAGDNAVDNGKRLTHTSSAGSVLARPAAHGKALANNNNESSSVSRRHNNNNSPVSRMPESTSVMNGVHSSISANSTQPVTQASSSYKSPITADVSVPSFGGSSSSGLSSIDSMKLSSVNMRSLTKSTQERKVSTERKTSSERKVSSERRLSSEKRTDKPPVPAPLSVASSERKVSSERRLSSEKRTDKPPVPAPLSVASSRVPKPGSGGGGGVSRVAAEAEEGEGHNTQVVYSRQSSFKVLNVSSSSHRIMHTVQDGGAPKRHNSINRGSRPVSMVTTNNTPTMPPIPTRLVTDVHSAPKLEKHPPPSSVFKSGLEKSRYHGSNLVNGVEEVHTSGAKSTGQDRKEGTYDRLSPPVDNPSAAKKEEPVYETIKDGHQNLTSPEASAKEDAGRTESSKPAVNSLRLGRCSSDREKHVIRRPLEPSSNAPVSRADASRSLKTGIGRNSAPNTTRPASTQRGRPDGAATSSISRYSTESGAVYTAVDKRGGTLSPLHAVGDSQSHAAAAVIETCTSSIPKRIPQTRPHKALSSSLSDSSVDSCPSRTPEISTTTTSTSESDIDRASGRPDKLWRQKPELLAPEKRQAMLELNLSHQSLDRNMRDVATSAVAALSTLMEVLTTPADASKDSKFRFDNVDSTDGADSGEKKWYQNSDEDDESSSATFSPSHSVTSPTSQTGSRLQLPNRGGTSSKEACSFAGGKTNGENEREGRDSISQTEAQRNRRTASTKSATPVDRGDSQADGNAISRAPSGGRVKRSGSKPPVPPKKKRQRSKSAGTIAGGVRPANSNHSRAASSIVSVVAARKGSNPDSTPTETEASSTSLESYASGNSPASTTSLTSEGKRGKPVNHDYAILEPPPDHDYAILDPEYHQEFFGYCANCAEPVIGMKNGCAALGNVYHNKCFNCSKCGTSLSNHSFYSYQGQLLCEKDHQEVTLDLCHGCKKNIADRVLKALGHSYHPGCFRCVLCGRCLDGIHYTSDGKGGVYCVQDYHKVYGPKCDVCQKPIIPRNGQKRSLRVIAMDKNYHIHCYKCEDCGKQLANRTGGGVKCYPLNGHLLCRHCHAQRAHVKTSDLDGSAESHAHQAHSDSHAHQAHNSHAHQAHNSHAHQVDNSHIHKVHNSHTHQAHNSHTHKVHVFIDSNALPS